MQNQESKPDNLKNSPIMLRIDGVMANAMWSRLEAMVREILRDTPPFNIRFEDLYRLSYTMVLHRHGEQLYNGLVEVITEHLQETVRPRVIASSDRNFLQTVQTVWSKYQASVETIKACLIYMDRVYVAEHKLYSSHDLGLNLFRDQIVNHEDIRDRIKTALSGISKIESEGKTIDHVTVEGVCQMMMALGLVLS